MLERAFRTGAQSHMPYATMGGFALATILRKWTRLKEPERENAKLKRVYAELAPENVAIKDVLARKL